MAMGCSTNAIIHLVAMARRAGFDIGLDDFDRASRVVPVIANIRPSGDTYLMEDFFYAGGLPALMSRLARPSAAGRAHRHRQDPRREHRRRRGVQRRRDPQRRRPPSTPRARSRCCAATSRPTAASSSRAPARRELLRHTGPALVFDDYPAMKAAVDDESLDVTADARAGAAQRRPAGRPRHARVGHAADPEEAAEAGRARHGARRDARMSGTSYGACILHVAPESYVGGPLALVRTGDLITVDVAGAAHPPRGQRRGAGRAPRRLDAAAAALRARLRLDVLAAHPPGRRGLRLRLPRDLVRRAGRRAEHLLRTRD